MSSLAKPTVVATATALPRHRYSQSDLAQLAVRMISPEPGRAAAIARFFERVGVGERYLALPAEAYVSLGGLERRSRAWLEVASTLGAATARAALDDAGMEARDVGLLMTTTVTGIAVPSLDARLMNVVPFAPSLKRVPMFGLGCLGGAAGIARASEYLLAFPDQAAMLLSVELCSLTFQCDDASVANVLSTGLFGDGAAAVLMVGARHPLSSSSRDAGPRIVASRSVFFPNTERVMGWDVVDSGFKVVLSPDVPKIVRAHVPAAVDGLLAEHGLVRGDVASWVMHPGGPKVIDALEESLELREGALAPTRDGLEKYGNLSSASVLFLLDDHRRARPQPRGTYGILMAMGPAFCAEIVLFQW